MVLAGYDVGPTRDANLQIMALFGSIDILHLHDTFLPTELPVEHGAYYARILSGLGIRELLINCSDPQVDMGVQFLKQCGALATSMLRSLWFSCFGPIHTGDAVSGLLAGPTSQLEEFGLDVARSMLVRRRWPSESLGSCKLGFMAVLLKMPALTLLPENVSWWRVPGLSTSTTIRHIVLQLLNYPSRPKLVQVIINANAEVLRSCPRSLLEVTLQFTASPEYGPEGTDYPDSTDWNGLDDALTGLSQLRVITALVRDDKDQQSPAQRVPLEPFVLRSDETVIRQTPASKEILKEILRKLAFLRKIFPRVCSKGVTLKLVQAYLDGSESLFGIDQFSYRDLTALL